jgi:hypothetical protein
MKVERDPRAGIAGPSLLICPNPSHTTMGKLTKRVNEFIPVRKTSGFREMSTEGQGGVVVPGPLAEEASVGSNEITLFSRIHM